MLDYTSIPSDAFLTSSRTRSGLVPPFSRFTLENAGKTGRSVGGILDQSAMRSAAGREKAMGQEVNACWQNEIFDNAASMVPQWYLCFTSLGPLCFLGFRGPKEEIPRTGPRNPRSTRGATEAPHRVK
jgi:hypothetical protein